MSFSAKVPIKIVYFRFLTPCMNLLTWDCFLVISLNRKDYFDIPWTDLRSMVEPIFAEKALIKHSEYLSNGTTIISRAIDITATEVLTDEGRAVPYDFLVVATGHNEAIPKTKTERLEQFKKGTSIY
jgi:apoptosis-inducing factor 2